MLWSFVYLVVRNLFALVWLLGRPRRSKELEILVLRHELAILHGAREGATALTPRVRRRTIPRRPAATAPGRSADRSVG